MRSWRASTSAIKLGFSSSGAGGGEGGVLAAAKFSALSVPSASLLFAVSPPKACNKLSSANFSVKSLLLVNFR